MKVRNVIKRIEADGWYYIGTVGSHRHFKHPTKRGKTTVAGHPNKEVPRGTLAQIWIQTGLPKP